LGVLYFIFSAILDVASNVSQLSEASTPLRLLCILPVALLDALLYCWVLTGLTATLSQLTSRRQSAKLLLYRRFSHVLLASVVVSVCWVCWQMATILSDTLDQRWATIWLFDAFWHVLYFVLLLAVCSLWSPSKNNLQYAYMDEVGQEDEMQPADHDDAQ
jgi:amino acid permease